MKLVTAIIKPDKVEALRKSLTGIDIQGLTILEAKGYGRQKGHTEMYRGAEYTVDTLPKIKIEVITQDDDLTTVTETIISSSHTGAIGDGKIFVSSLDEVIRIRTGETGNEAI